MHSLESSTFDEVISSSDLAVVDFWAAWCGPCKAFAPVFEQVSASYPGVVFAKVDVDSAPDLAKRFGVMSIPTIAFFKNGELVDAAVGALPERSLRAALDSISNS